MSRFLPPSPSLSLPPLSSSSAAGSASGGAHQATLQEQVGGHGAQWLPLPQAVSERKLTSVSFLLCSLKLCCVHITCYVAENSVTSCVCSLQFVVASCIVILLCCHLSLYVCIFVFSCLVSHTLPLRLVVQRTKRIDETQQLLLDMLEDLTSGTDQERQEFMAVCVETLNNFKKSDMLTPIFVFERLCSIIHPVS